MTNEDILKLLGGYATNTLSENERKALFEAALADQKLFNALQEEEALKELLADASARAEIRRALEAPGQAAWWSRRWVWASALATAAVVILALVVVRPFERPREVAFTNELAGKIAADQVQPAPANEPAPKVAPAPPAPLNARTPAPRRAMAARERQSVATPSPAAPPAAAARASALRALTLEPNAQRAAAAGSAGSISGSIGGVAAGSVATVALPVRYSLVKRDAAGAETPVTNADLKPGEVVRIRVTAATPGYLHLFQRDATGDLLPVFPPDASPLQITANASVTLDWPIVIQNGPQNFRLTLAPIQPLAAIASDQLKKQSIALPAVDIRIAPEN